MPSLWNDVKYAVALLARKPGFTLAAVASLALGIGANIAIFTVVDAVLLKPLAYPDSDRIVEFGFGSSLIEGYLSNVPEFHLYQQQTALFSEVAAYDMSGPGFNLTVGRPERRRLSQQRASIILPTPW